MSEAETFQMESKVCGLKMELREKGAWDCEPFLEYRYGNHLNPPDCTKCEYAKRYGIFDALAVGNEELTGEKHG